jgi:quercetin dioxygenase-like cupin family protein
MISHEGTKYREHMRDGRGTVTIHDVLSKEDLNGHGRLYARIVLPAGASIGWHVHEGETEPFYILKGEGTFIDNDHVAHIVHPGDVCTIEAGQGHSMENNSDEDLEMMALIYYVD